MYTVQTGKKDAPQLGLEGLEQDDQVPLETLGKSIFFTTYHPVVRIRPVPDFCRIQNGLKK